MRLKIQGIIKQSSVDGEGIRYVIFCQGCPHHCKGCHNPETWNPDKGYFIETDDILEEIKYDPLLDGVTFSGGEPFLQQDVLVDLAKKIKNLGLDIWCYTGYDYEDIKDSPLIKSGLIDVLVDGRYMEDLRTLDGFKGSSNQRIIRFSTVNGKTAITKIES